MKALFKGILSANRGRALAAVALAILVGATEGATLLLLIPLLHLAGVSSGASPVAGSLAGIFNRLSLTPTLSVVLLLYISLTIAQGLLARLQRVVDTEVIQNYALALRTRLYSSIARAEWLVVSRIRSSDFTFALTTAVDNAEHGAYSVLGFVSSSAVAIFYLALAVRLSPTMSAVVIGLGALLLLAERARVVLGKKAGGMVTSTTQDLFATAAEQLGGLKTAKSYGQEERHLSLFLDASDRLNKANLAMTRAFASLRLRLTIGSVIALSLILYLAVEVIVLPTASILLLLFLFSRLVPRLVNLQSTLQQVFSALPALETIDGLIEQCERFPEAPHQTKLPIALRNEIRLDDVSFSYSGTTPQLMNLDLTIAAGDTTAVVGASGAGKSTFADMLLGLIVPSSGQILIDGVPLDSGHLESWRGQIGYVAQETFLFNETIRVNLDWAQPGASEQAMIAALRSAAAWEYVSSLPLGIDTIIGERGVRLSGGERQRLSLARALLRHPRLLILDEATSALDSENEIHIYRAVQALHGEATIVVITHRLATVRGADRIHVLDRGRLVASGSWEDLMKSNNPRFRELCQAQGIAVSEGESVNV